MRALFIQIAGKSYQRQFTCPGSLIRRLYYRVDATAFVVAILSLPPPRFYQRISISNLKFFVQPRAGDSDGEKPEDRTDFYSNALHIEFRNSSPALFPLSFFDESYLYAIIIGL